jgi:DNA-binding response OmpR family regulator
MNKAWVDLTALLVEDDKIQAQTTLAVLESAGFKAVWKDTGSNAIEAYRASPFNLVVVDLMLPDMKGCDVISIMRTHADHAAVIIALTGTADQEQMAGSLQAGADDIYVKSVGSHVLRAKFSRLAIEMADSRRKDDRVEEMDARISNTIAELTACSAEKQKELDDLKDLLKQPPLLTEEQIEAIADRAAKKAVAEAAENAAQIAMELMERNMKLRVGAFVLNNMAIVVGAAVIGLASWAAGKGLLKI